MVSIYLVGADTVTLPIILTYLGAVRSVDCGDLTIFVLAPTAVVAVAEALTGMSRRPSV